MGKSLTPGWASPPNRGTKTAFEGSATPRDNRPAPKNPAKSHAVDAARQLASMPNFNAVGMPAAMELPVGPHHFRCDPSAFFPSHGTSVHDGLKVLIDGDAKPPGANCALQAAGDMKSVELKNCTW